MAWYKGSGKGIGKNLFSLAPLVTASTGTTWTKYNLVSTVNEQTGTGILALLDSDFGHLDNGGIVIDKAVPKAYLTGATYVIRNSSGAAIYAGVRFKKNGTEITGTSIMGTSSNNQPNFRRVETSFAVGDVITVEYKFSTTNNAWGYIGTVNIITD